nr:outer membrane protein assembly factor [Burkholderiales bacterium]
MHFAGRFPAILVCLFAALSTGYAVAAEFSYRVEIDAPKPLRQLLTEHLEIISISKKQQMNLEQLRRVYRQTVQEIEKLAATEGYFSPEILPSLEETRGGWVARFVVHPGEPVRVAEVVIGFNGAVAAADNEDLRRQLRDEWRLKENMAFRQIDWDTAKRGLLQPLLLNRYPAARIVDSQAFIDAASRSAKLTVEVDSGPLYTFGPLSIAGLERYSPTVIEHLNPITQGEEYNQEKLLDFQQQLQNTGYFATAVVTIDADTADPSNVPVKVIVTEAATKKIAFGVGYSTDVGNRFSTEYQHLNFLAQGWRLRSALRLETRRQSITGEIHFPRTVAGYDDSISATAERQDIQGETLRRYGTTAT